MNWKSIAARLNFDWILIGILLRFDWEPIEILLKFWLKLLLYLDWKSMEIRLRFDWNADSNSIEIWLEFYGDSIEIWLRVYWNAEWNSTKSYCTNAILFNFYWNIDGNYIETPSRWNWNSNDFLFKCYCIVNSAYCISSTPSPRSRFPVACLYSLYPNRSGCWVRPTKP